MHLNLEAARGAGRIHGSGASLAPGWGTDKVFPKQADSVSPCCMLGDCTSSLLGRSSQD